jgi:uncharacterized protein
VRILVIAFLLCGITATAQQTDYTYTPVPFTNVKLTDNFWLPRIKINHTVTIPASFERCDKTGRIKNFLMAATKTGKFCTTFPFDDTDIYKTIEGASFSISLFPDKKLDSYMDSLIAIIAAAQEPDGYLYTARTIDPKNPHAWSGNERWVKERELSHELYNSGHMFEAAVAHFMATGKKNFLNIALKNANLVCHVFGKDKMHMAPGHQVVEMGLVKLYRITGKKEYLQTAKYFIEERGHYAGYDSKSKDQWKNGAYWQDNIPVTAQREATGHAVRAGYLYAAVADIAALTGDKEMLDAIDSIWLNMVNKKLYVQGGAGAIGSGERYGENFELPNATAYNETCAAIANVYWNQRMFQLHGDAKYVDVLERILYNGLIAGVGLDGKSFFYTNAMEVNHRLTHKHLEAERSGWFDCSCCPTNICRLLPSMPGYMYAIAADKLYVNLFANSSAQIVVNKKQVTIEQQNNYPWDGNLKFIISPKTTTPFNLLVRVPGWAQQQPMPSSLYHYQNSNSAPVIIKVNGVAINYTLQNGYVAINRSWKKNDVVEMLLPMDIKRVASSEALINNKGLVSLQRGPLVYCAEWADNNGSTTNLVLPANQSLTAVYNSNLLNGVMTLQGNVIAVVTNTAGNSVQTQTQPFTAIPYYAWANRGRGEMTVWLPEKIADVLILAH